MLPANPNQTTPHSNGSRPTPGSAIYVDTENLRDNDRAQDVIAQAVARWPAAHPPVASLSLYVRSDKVALWQMWAEATYPTLAVRVRGVQHFSVHKAKNSADLAITADAVADLITGRAATVAVISNDSDFGALFVKVRELADAAGGAPAPFLWITAPDAGALSPEMERFIPALYRWDLASAAPEPTLTTALPGAPASAPVPTVSAPTPKPLPDAVHPPALPPAPQASPAASAAPEVSSADIAAELIRQLPLGRFRASDAQRVIKQRWPRHPALDSTSHIGQLLLNEIWPALRKYGVMMPRNNSPRAYEITQAAKDAIACAGPALPSSDRPGGTHSEATRRRYRHRHHRRHFQRNRGPGRHQGPLPRISRRIPNCPEVRHLVQKLPLAGDETPRRQHRRHQPPPLRNHPRRPPPHHRPPLTQRAMPRPNSENSAF